MRFACACIARGIESIVTWLPPSLVHTLAGVADWLYSPFGGIDLATTSEACSYIRVI